MLMSAALHCHGNCISQQLSQFESYPSTSPVICGFGLLLSYPSPLSGRLLHLNVTFPGNSWYSYLQSSFQKEGEEDASIYLLSTYLHNGVFSDMTDYLLVVVYSINIWLAGLKGNLLWLVVLLPYHLKLDY